MSKTYVPTLRIVLRAAYRYATRWQPKLAETLTTQQAECLSAVIAALYECLLALGEATLDP